jgi:hypothetical protein
VREVLDVSGPPQWIEACPRLPWVDTSDPYLPGKSQLTWAAAGGTMDGRRLLFVGWVRQVSTIPSNCYQTTPPPSYFHRRSKFVFGT